MLQPTRSPGDTALLNAARAVREGPPENFSMGAYASRCGTPSCVLGHYAARADLQRLLTLSPKGVLLYAEAIRGPDGDPTMYEGFADYDDISICNHFEITKEEAGMLFSGDGCGGAVENYEAADYIEAFVAERIAARLR